MTTLGTIQRLLAPALLAGVSAADVLYVDASGNGQFTSIQSAIQAANDGDVLLVRTGTYAGFTVDGRSLWIVADTGALPKVLSTATVLNTPAGATVLLSGLEVTTPDSSQAQVPLVVSSNPGHVRVQACKLRGGDGFFGVIGFDGATATTVSNSAKVAFVECTLNGGDGGGIPLFVAQGGDGGHGAVTQGSAVAFYDCTVKGGAGGSADYVSPNETAGDGGDGCRVLDYGILASGSRFEGGGGGTYASVPGNGGDGLYVDAGQAQLIGNTYVGGQGGWGYHGNFGASGAAQSGPGVFNTHAGPARKLVASALAGEQSALTFDVTGQPGDRVWILPSPLPDFLYVPAHAGVRLIASYTQAASRPHVVLGPSGAATVTVVTPRIPAGLDAAPQIWQCVALDTSGQFRLGSARHVTVLNCSDLLPDCDGNGSCDSCDLLQPGAVDCDRNGQPDSCQPDCNANAIADPCDIASGTSIDQNHNGIPDDCEPQTTWHIDPAAAPAGNGSAGAPFQSLDAAFQRAIAGDTVLLADGLYQGAGNRNLDFDGRGFTVRSANGAANCILDCQLQGRAFVLLDGVPPSARIEGLTIRNGKVSGNLSGGAIFVEECSPTIRACVFESCQAPNGGAISMFHTGGLVEGCRFVANNAATAGGGLHAQFGSFGEIARIVDCDFVGNQAARGGGLSTSQLTIAVARCLFEGNVTVTSGGGLHSYFGDIRIDQCRIAGNRSSRGGGVSGIAGRIQLVDCTLTANTGTQRAGAAHYETGTGSQRFWRNTVVWNNTAPAATPVEVTHGPLDVAWCDLQGGPTSITVGASATLVWGPGNLDADPLFADPDGPDNDPLTIADNDYRLALGSPCLDAGANASVAPDWHDLDGDGDVLEPVPFDFDGNARFVDVPSAPDTGSGTPPLVDLGAWEHP